MFPRNQDVCFNLYIHVIKQTIKIKRQLKNKTNQKQIVKQNKPSKTKQSKAKQKTKHTTKQKSKTTLIKQ